ncbi:HTH-type transcriptional activator RhaS [compost metagenome]
MNEIRLNKAAHLLRTSSAPVKVIAEQTGFADIPYFSRAFKKKHGVSPQIFRNQQSGK